MTDRLEEARRWAACRHTRISSFGVCHFDAGGRYVVAECPSFDEARGVALRTAGDSSRPPVIVALTPEGWAFELEEVESG